MKFIAQQIIFVALVMTSFSQLIAATPWNPWDKASTSVSSAEPSEPSLEPAYNLNDYYPRALENLAMDAMFNNDKRFCANMETSQKLVLRDPNFNSHLIALLDVTLSDFKFHIANGEPRMELLPMDRNQAPKKLKFIHDAIIVTDNAIIPSHKDGLYRYYFQFPEFVPGDYQLRVLDLDQVFPQYRDWGSPSPPCVYITVMLPGEAGILHRL